MYDKDTPQLALKQLIKDLPKPQKGKTNIIVGHLTLDGSIPVGHEIDSNLNEIFCPMTMFKGFDYVVMGHIHNFQILENDPFIFHLGSMDRSNFSKTEMNGQKYLAVFDFASKKHLDFIPLPVRPLKKILIDIPKDKEFTTEYVLDALNNEDLENCLLNLEIKISSTQPEVNKDIVMNFLSSKKVFHTPKFSQSRSILVVQEDAVVLEKQTSPKQGVEKFLETFSTEMDLSAEDVERVMELANDCIMELETL